MLYQDDIEKIKAIVSEMIADVPAVKVKDTSKKIVAQIEALSDSTDAAIKTAIEGVKGEFEVGLSLIGEQLHVHDNKQ